MKVRKNCIISIFAVGLFALTCGLFCLFGNANRALALTSGEKPIMWSISEAVKPSETVTLSGNYLYAEGLQIAYAPNDGDDAGSLPATYSLITDVLVTSKDGTGIQFIFPATESTGEYDFWVKNSNGWSEKGITMNAPRALDIDQQAAYNGQKIEINGRNFSEYEYGVGTKDSWLNKVAVKLVDKNDPTKSYPCEVLTGIRYTESQSVTGVAVMDTNPYRISFIVPDITPSDYYVYVSANGVHYTKLESSQVLKIVEKKAQDWNETYFGPLNNNNHVGNDPLDLGVYWAQDLNYKKVFKVSKATGDVSTDTANIRNQINNAVNNHGGVVYFPEGEYVVSGISYTTENSLNKVIFVGAGADKTKILYNGYAIGSWWKLTGSSNMGFANISFGVKEGSVSQPDAPLNMADNNNTRLLGKATSSNKFLKNMEFNFRSVYMGDKGDGTETTARARATASGYENFIFSNVKYNGGVAVDFLFYRYARYDNCYIYGSSQCNAMYMFIENVHQDNHHAPWDNHGMTLRTAYLGNVLQENSGMPGQDANSGETILFEPPGACYGVGGVKSATARTITFNDAGTCETAGSYYNADNFSLELFGPFAVYIISGKGAGQVRHLQIVYDNFNVATGELFNATYQLAEGEEDWDVIPDSTSRYSLVCVMEGSTLYRVVGKDNQGPICLYQDQFDVLVSECYLENSGGVLVSGCQVETNGRFGPSNNIRIENNTIFGTGGSGYGPGNLTSISLRTDRQYNYYGAQISYVSIKNNYITSYDGNFWGYDEEGNRIQHGYKAYGIVFTTDHENDRKPIDASDGKTYQSKGVEVNGENVADIRFVTIEGNTITDTVYGIAFRNAYVRTALEGSTIPNVYGGYNGNSNCVNGVVIRNNAISDIQVESPILNDGKNAQIIVLDSATVSNIVYDLNGATNNERNQSAYIEGITTILHAPVKDDKAFLGWILNGGYELIESIPSTVTGEITLKPIFEGDSIPEPPQPQEDTTKDNGAKTLKGCSGSLISNCGVGFVVMAVALAVVCLKKKKYNK